MLRFQRSIRFELIITFLSHFRVYKYSASVVQADVQSQNIVGFQTLDIPAGEWCIITPTFKSVAAANNFKLGDITVCNAEGVEFDDKRSGGSGKSVGVVKVYKMNTASGRLGGNWAYTSTGYANRETTAKETWGWNVGRNELIADGEGLIVNNGGTTLVKFRVAGEVVLQPSIGAKAGEWGIIGNNTPVDRKLSDFMVCNSEGVEFDDKRSGGSGKSVGVVKVYKMNASSGLLGGNWAYTSTGYANRETTAKETWGWNVGRNEIIKAGEALVINNSGTADVIIKVKGPLAE